MPAYLDNAATTPMRPEAVEAMLPFLTDGFANPSGLHGASRRARRAVDAAREALAARLGCEPGELIWTSGGTEADNLAVLGAHEALGGTVVVSAIEHRAVLRPGEAVGARIAGATPEGTVDLDLLAEALDEGVGLVSVMAVNSEVGTVQPLEEVVRLGRRLAPRALLHCDAVQAYPWLDVAALCAGFDLVSVSAHKFGGPKGIGALVARGHAAASLVPRQLGGEQERGLRAGTENVAGIVATGVAAELAARERPETVERVAALRDRFVDGLLAAYPQTSEPAPREARVAGSAHVCFSGVEAEELLLMLDREEVAASTGSACASGARDPSHVLLAMGWAPSRARSAVRFSLGASTSPGEVDHALSAVRAVLARLAAATA
ncbi:MAG: putative cysteine desulfurase [Acidimicrobiaceae bacterium]|nr:putative cysteine desulfurase [Acidimicrobiaceae bacterium]